jgi:FKBP-type peptidyl-prolyl cis-trans isomerase SlyD
MEKITNESVVEINYTLFNNDGEVLDTSKDKGALAYIQGKQNIIPGLEKQLDGKKVGESLKLTISPEEAYGPRHESLVQAVPKTQFGENASQVQVGMQFEVEAEGGQMMVVTAIEISEDEVVLDGNHPLAGETLNFDVEVLSVRQATEEELKEGFVKKEAPSCGCC